MRLFRGGESLSLHILAIVAALTLSSCGSSLSQKLSIESYDNLKIAGFTGATIDLGVRNESGYKVKVEEVSITLREGVNQIGTATLKDETTIPRRTELEVIPTMWRFSQVNAIYALSAANRLLNDEMNSTFVVDIEGQAKIGLIRKKFEQRNIPLKTILNEIE